MTLSRSGATPRGAVPRSTPVRLATRDGIAHHAAPAPAATTITTSTTTIRLRILLHPLIDTCVRAIASIANRPSQGRVTTLPRKRRLGARVWFIAYGLLRG